MSIPTLTYGFLGVEIVAVTAFEALDRRSLRLPTRWIAWIMTLLYLFVAIPGAFLIDWHARYLADPEITSGKATVSRRADPPPPPAGCYHQTYPYIVLAAETYGNRDAGRFFLLCIIYFCISAANTALYVASRTLYGIFRPLGQREHRELRWWEQARDLPHLLGSLSSRQVPVAAIIVSALSWIWLIALRARSLNVSSATSRSLTLGDT